MSEDHTEQGIKEDALMRVSYGFLIATLPFFVGFVVWLAALRNDTSANAAEAIALKEDLNNMTRENKELLKIVTDMDKKITEIRTLLRARLDPEQDR